MYFGHQGKALVRPVSVLVKKWRDLARKLVRLRVRLKLSIHSYSNHG